MSLLFQKTDELDATTWHNLNCNLLRLKTVKITVWVKKMDYCRSSTFELARTLLERAPNLEKMDIVFIKSQWDIIPLTNYNDLIEKLETLISHPKSSHQSKIVISSIISDYIYRRWLVWSWLVNYHVILAPSTLMHYLVCLSIQHVWFVYAGKTMILILSKHLFIRVLVILIFYACFGIYQLINW